MTKKYDDYFKLWRDPASAANLIANAVSNFFGVLFEGKEVSEGRFSISIDRDPVDQFSKFYENLLRHDVEAAQGFAAACIQLYGLYKEMSPPNYFQAAVLGLFMLRALEDRHKPSPGALLVFLRPLSRSSDARARDLYLSALFFIGEAVATSPPSERKRSMMAISAEWEYLSKTKEGPPASLARILSSEQPHHWPELVSTVFDFGWNFDLNEDEQQALERATQNIVIDLDPEIIANELWKLADFVDSQGERAIALFRALFGTDDPETSELIDPPFTLIKASELDHYTSWRVAASNATEKSWRRQFAVSQGQLSLRDPNARSLSNALTLAFCAGLIQLMVA